MLIDTHCHIVEKEFDHDRQDVIERMFKDNNLLINCSTDLASSKKSLEMVQTFSNKGVFTAVGFDPQETIHQDYHKEDFDTLIKDNRNSIIAVGEIGLEYFKQQDFLRQREVFKSQVQLAKKYKLPVIIHCRDFDDNRNHAYEEVCNVLDEIDSPYKGVVHCFSGNVEQAQEITKRGYYLGFNGIITFKKPGFTHEVLRSIDPQYILTETDAPYLAPVPFRGQRNEPFYVKEVVRTLAEVLGVSVLQVSDITYENAKRLFGV